ncbi:hypothetical protein Q7P36_001864 [Cladosporium allicinum]
MASATHSSKATDFSSTLKHGTRKGSITVPCNACILNASKGTSSRSNQLCETCMECLHRPRRRQQQAANTGKIHRRSNATIETALELHPKPTPVPCSEDRQVQRSLRFFIHHSAPQLAGYFDSPFWQHMQLESGFQSPAVKHAIAAIGALHERLLLGPDDKDSSNPRKCGFALEQCNQSIQHLVKPINGKQPDLNLLLTTCILFTCFEAMQGHCEQAISHAKQGYALLDQYAIDPQSRACETGVFAAELDQLCLMMQRLQTQSKGLLAEEYHTVGEDLGIKAIPKPAYFETLQDARMALEKMIDQFSIFFLDLDLNDEFYDMVRGSPHNCVSQTVWLEAWEKAFSQLLSRKQAELTPSERRGAMVLKAHHLVCDILSKVDLSEGAPGWDRFHRSFTAIVDLAESVLGTNPQSITSHPKDSSGTLSTKLCFSLGILDPLYEVCARCRDPLLRRRALDLLAGHPRQECLWGSWSAWKVGRYLLHLEEWEVGSQPTVVNNAASDHIPEVPFNFNALHVSEEGRLMQRHTNSHNPREALNPGLFAGRDFLDARGKPDKLFTELKPTPPVLDSEMRYQSATLSPRDA